MKTRKPQIPKTIEEELGMEPPEEIELEYYDSKSKGEEEDLKTDYELAREKIIQSLTRGSEVLDAATRSVLAEPNARSIEVASTSLKQLSETSKHLLELHEVMRKFQSKEEAGKEKIDTGKIRTNINNIIKLVDKDKAASN